MITGSKPYFKLKIKGNIVQLIFLKADPIFFVFYFVCRMNSKLFEKIKTQ